MSDHELTDFEDRPILVGTRVAMWDAELDAMHDVDGLVGTVASLGEWDGDVDDEGRSIAIFPRLTVRFDDGTAASFATCDWRAPYDEIARGRVEDVDVLR